MRHSRSNLAPTGNRWWSTTHTLDRKLYLRPPRETPTLPRSHCAWDGKEAAQVGEGEEGGPVGGAEPGDPSLAGEAVLPMKLRVYRLGICLLVSVQLLL